MNKLALLAIVAVVFTACGDSKEKQMEQTKALYQSALKHSDPNTAVVALNKLLVLDPGNLEYRDSLCRTYLRGGNSKGGMAIAEEIQDSVKFDNSVMEMLGVAYQTSKDYQKSAKVFNKLFNNTKDYRYLYQVAALAYEKSNKMEFDSLTNILLNDAVNDSLIARTLIDFPGPLSGSPQYIPLEPATMFLKAKYAMDKSQDLATAIQYFRQSINLYEQFEMPWYYLQQIEEYQRSGGR